MKERPILFSGPMVRALLNGSKTQTRRVMSERDRYHFIEACGDLELCPYGKPGDRLWVRETWRGVVAINPPGKSTELAVARYVPNQEHCRGVEFQATQDRDGEPWRPSIHMPRWASRITLGITGVRVEQLQGISEKDGLAEGCPINEINPIGCYAELWDSLNAARGFGWQVNPWVWVVEFDRASAC